MGWSSWYGFTSNIDEALLYGIAEGLTAPRTLRNGSTVSLASMGFVSVWVDDGWALPRDPVTNKIVVDPVLFPSGFRNLSDTLHAKGLLFGVYTDEGPLTVRAHFSPCTRAGRAPPHLTHALHSFQTPPLYVYRCSAWATSPRSQSALGAAATRRWTPLPSQWTFRLTKSRTTAAGRAHSTTLLWPCATR